MPRRRLARWTGWPPTWICRRPSAGKTTAPARTPGSEAGRRSAGQLAGSRRRRRLFADQPPEGRQSIGAQRIGGRAAERRLHVLPHLLPPADRPLVAASERPIGEAAVKSNVHVVVVRLRVAGLVQNERGARQQRRVIALRRRLAQQRRAQAALDEDPLHLRL